MSSNFVHLHTHSHYSLLNALPKIKDLVSRAKKHGMTALALTDNGNLYGAIEFWSECQKQEIKPLIGIDAYVAPRTRHDREPKIDVPRTRLVLIAKDDTGYQNLMRLVTDSFLDGFYYKPRIDRELIEKYKEGMVCISPSFAGDISQALKQKNGDRARELVDWYKSVFGKDFYIEITHHPEFEGHQERMDELVALARATETPLVAAHDVYYLDKEDAKAREVMIAIQNGGGRSDLGDLESDEDFSFIDGKTAEKYFKKIPDAIDNAAKIADEVTLKIELDKWVFPKIDIPDGFTADDVLKDIVYEGFERRGVEKRREILERVEYELSVIRQKGYAPYFLVVADLLRFARENGILSNIRGSVSGSMVTYLSGITNIDPLYFEIPFERFLNPERPSAPDIDMDYADNRRDEMVEYARRKYGNDRVAQIGTFGTMMARGAVRDVARALGHPYAVGDRIAKLIPMGKQGFEMTLDKAMKIEPELKALYKDDPDAKAIIDMAKKIEGCARHISIHAAGVVISPTEITNFTPLQFDPKGENKILTQYDMYSIEPAGLLKFDFLGLRNLSIIANAVDLVKRTKGEDIDLDGLPMDDKKTYEMLARGETADLFQLNGAAMTKFLVELRPSTIHDINAMVALYRPGPMEFIPEFIARKHGKVKITYLDPALEPILAKTYGILVYQDDLLMMAHKLAGYSWGEVDKFRKAVGKKIPEEMAKQKDKFIEGCQKHSGWSEKKAVEVWKWIEPFAAYGFNKAHSVSYGRVAYLTAYLKANHPGEYMTAVLTAESGNTEKVSETVAECKRMGIEVLPPDLNESYREFTVLKDGGVDRIRFGLGSIKNFGEGIADAIIAERKRGGRFGSLAEFLDRVQDRNLNRKSLESLIKCGAMDALGERGQLIANLDSIIAYNKESKSTAEGQTSLFGLMTDTATVPTLKLEPAPPAAQTDKLLWEKELLGLYVSGHPLDRFREKFESKGITVAGLKSKKEKADVVFGGIIEECKEIFTKKGDKMVFMRVADFTDSIEVVLFPDSYATLHEVCKPDTCVAVKGKISMRNGSHTVIADKIKELGKEPVAESAR